MNSPRVLSAKGYRFGISFTVEGSHGKTYTVDWNITKGWICDCPHHMFRNAYCKHILACRNYAVQVIGIELHDKLYCNDPTANKVMV